MTPTLRDYQAQAVGCIRDAYRQGHRSVLFVLPTGGGKTVVFSHIAQQAAARGNRICVLVHRVELLEQASRSLAALGVEHGLIAAGRAMDLSASVQVASVATLARRLGQLPTELFQLLVVDEAHHSNAGTWAKTLAHFSAARVLGVTATPVRSDGRGLGEWYQAMVLGPSPAELTAAGHLAPARVFAPPIGFSTKRLRKRMGDFDLNQAAAALGGSRMMGDAVGHYQRLLPGRTAVAFCCSVAHAEAVAQLFTDHGIPAASIDGRMDAATREGLLSDLGDGRLKVLTSCALIGEGVDVPSVAGCILLRPIQSLALHLQMIGRCLRPQPGKVAVVLDHVGNCHRHGLPTDEREWTLDGVAKRSREAAPSVRVCPSCFCAMPSGTPACPECGHQFQPEIRELEHVDGQLVEIKGWNAKKLDIKPGDQVYTIDEWKRCAGPYIVKRFTRCNVICHAPGGSEYYFLNEKIWIPPFKKGDKIVRKNHDTKNWDDGWTVCKYDIAKEFVLAIRSDQYEEGKDYSFAVGSTVRMITRGNYLLDDGTQPPLKQEQSSAQTLSDLVAVGKRRGMSNPHAWARHVLAARMRKRSQALHARIVA